MLTPTAAPKITFVVVHENMLCYVHPLLPGSVQILRASIVRGASRIDGSYPLTLCRDNIRPAKRKDFEEFRLHTGGYETCHYHDFPKE